MLESRMTSGSSLVAVNLEARISETSGALEGNLWSFCDLKWPCGKRNPTKR